MYGTYYADEGDESLASRFMRRKEERVLHADLLEPALESDFWVFIPLFGTAS